MKTFLILLVFIVHITTCLAVQSNPDEPLSHTDNVRYSTANAHESLVIISEALDSYKKMVKATADEKPIFLKNYKHTNFEMLNLGLPNMLGAVEGALRKQSYLNAKLSYELEMEKKKNNSASKVNMSSLKKNI